MNQPVQQVVVTRPMYRNGMATTSLVCGLATFFTCGVSGIFAVIFGHVAMSEVKRHTSDASVRATFGLMLGYVSLAFWGLVVVMRLFG